jgi:hypothetical protein
MRALACCLKIKTVKIDELNSYFIIDLSNAPVCKGNAMNHSDLFFQAGDKGQRQNLIIHVVEESSNNKLDPA